MENETLLALGEAAAASDPVSGFRLIQKASAEGKDLSLFARQIAGFFRDLLLLLWTETVDEVHLSPEEKKAARAIAEKLGVAKLKRGVTLFLEAGTAARRGSEGSLPLEMAFLQLLTEEEAAKAAVPDQLVKKVAALERRLAQLEAVLENRSPAPWEPAAKAAPAAVGTKVPAALPGAGGWQPFTLDRWEEVLEGSSGAKGRLKPCSGRGPRRTVWEPTGDPLHP